MVSQAKLELTTNLLIFGEVETNSKQNTQTVTK